MKPEDIKYFRNLASLYEQDACTASRLVDAVKAHASVGSYKGKYEQEYECIMSYVMCFDEKPKVYQKTQNENKSSVISDQFKNFNVINGKPRGFKKWAPPYLAWFHWRYPEAASAMLEEAKKRSPNLDWPEFVTSESAYKNYNDKQIRAEIKKVELRDKAVQPMHSGGAPLPSFKGGCLSVREYLAGGEFSAQIVILDADRFGGHEYSELLRMLQMHEYSFIRIRIEALDDLKAIQNRPINCAALLVASQSFLWSMGLDGRVQLRNVVEKISANKIFYMCITDMNMREVKYRFIEIHKQNLLTKEIPAKNVFSMLILAVAKSLNGSLSCQDYSKSIDKRLTGRRFLEEILKQEVERHKSESTLVALIDIDRMNQINSKFNDQLGDRVLSQVEYIISESITEFSAAAGRCGDDTFYFVIYNYKKFREVNPVETFVENMIREIHEYDWSELANKLFVTASAGFATLYADEDPLQTVLRACIGLNKAQRNGGNCVQQGPQYLASSTPPASNESTWGYFS